MTAPALLGDSPTAAGRGRGRGGRLCRSRASRSTHHGAQGHVCSRTHGPHSPTDVPWSPVHFCTLSEWQLTSAAELTRRTPATENERRQKRARTRGSAYTVVITLYHASLDY